MVVLSEPTSRLVREAATSERHPGSRRSQHGDEMAILEEFRQQALPHFRRGIELTDRGRMPDALAEFNKALALLPSDLAFLTNRGAALDRLGLHAEALADFDRVLMARPDDAVGNHNRGVALAQLGQYEEAVSAYDRALTAAPEDAGTLANKGLAFAHMDRLEEALSFLNQANAREFKKETAAARTTILGELLRRLNDDDLISWAGGKPKGSADPVQLTSGPDISEYLVEDRR